MGVMPVACTIASEMGINGVPIMRAMVHILTRNGSCAQHRLAYLGLLKDSQTD